MILPSQRHLFDLPRDICYLNAAYMTPQTKAMVDAGMEGVRVRKEVWKLTAEDFFTTVEKLRALSAQLFGANTDDMAIILSASYGISTATKNLALSKGDVILLLDEQFPSNVYPWRRLADEASAEIVTVPYPEDHDLTTAVVQKMDELGERLKVVAMEQVHWATGAEMDLKAVSAKTKALGAKLVLDLSQSLSVLPFSVADIDPDYTVAAGYKWLFCPYAVSFLYVAPRNQNGLPLEENWANRKDSVDMARLVDYQDQYMVGARRFDMGERASFSLLPHACASVSKLLEWGSEDLRDTARDKNRHLEDILGRYGFRALPESVRSAHILSLDFPDNIKPKTMLGLKDKGVLWSVRGSSLRVSPHVYNDDEDFDRLEKILADTL